MRCGKMIVSAVAVFMVIALPQAGQAFFGITDLQYMVQNADVVVRAKVVGPVAPPPPVGHGGPDMIRVLEVEKVLAGRCPSSIRVDLASDHAADASGFAVGDVYYLCLVRSDEHAGVYREINFGYDKVLIKDGRAVLPPKLEIPEHVKDLFKDLEAEKFEAGLVWLRGPRLEVRPAKAAFACDEPLTLEATLTNPSTLPMPLTVGSGRATFHHFSLRLADARGYDVLAREKYGGLEDSGDAPPEDQVRSTETLAPGQSITRTVSIPIRLAEFVEDPTTVRTASLLYRPDATVGAWRGEQCARCDVRIACPYRAWAADLRQPNDQWAATLSTELAEPILATVATARDVWLSVALFRVRSPRETPYGRQEWSGKTFSEVRVGPDDEKALAACFRVERDGKGVRGPTPQPDRVRAWLDGLEPKDSDILLKSVNLGRHFDFSAPGAYRVRLVLPGPKEPSTSGVLTVTVPAAEPQGNR